MLQRSGPTHPRFPDSNREPGWCFLFVVISALAGIFWRLAKASCRAQLHTFSVFGVICRCCILYINVNRILRSLHCLYLTVLCGNFTASSNKLCYNYNFFFLNDVWEWSYKQGVRGRWEIKNPPDGGVNIEVSLQSLVPLKQWPSWRHPGC